MSEEMSPGAGYVRESSRCGPTLEFDLWINHRAGSAAVTWVAKEGLARHSHMAEWTNDGGVVLSSRTSDHVPATNNWLGMLWEIGRAFRLAFPEEGSAYPDVLVREFGHVMENFNVSETTAEES